MKNARLFVISISVLLVSAIFSSIILSTVTAQTSNSPNLPNTSVTIKAFDGKEQYFVIQLSNVPSGYGITNGNYSGWCIDRSKVMERAPATHQVLLYSSLNPPSSLSNYSWNQVNYLLNHKQGNKIEIQDAVWHFVNLNGTYNPPPTPAITAMINDATTNGTNFIPKGQEKVAIIANPVSTLPTDSPVQISILEGTASTISNTIVASPTPTPNTSTSPSLPVYLYLVIAAIIAIIIVALAVAVRRRRKF